MKSITRTHACALLVKLLKSKFPKVDPCGTLEFTRRKDDKVQDI